jgi:hypothetical protein
MAGARGDIIAPGPTNGILVFLRQSFHLRHYFLNRISYGVFIIPKDNARGFEEAIFVKIKYHAQLQR